MLTEADRDSQIAGQLLVQGRFVEAAERYRMLLSKSPQRADDWYNLGYCLRQMGDYEHALTAYAASLDLGIQCPEEVHLNRAVIYSDGLRCEDEAELELTQALTLAPAYMPAWLNLGNLHEERGEREAAIRCYEKILSLDPLPSSQQGLDALARLSHLRPPQALDDQRLAKMTRAIADPAFGMHSRAGLSLALGRVFDQMGEYVKAFAAWQQGNSLLQGLGPRYDRGRQEAIIDTLIELFAEPDPVTEPAADGPSPLFICGLFRSGSTMLEQALAMHPDLVAGGELDYFPRLIASEILPFPEALAHKTTDWQQAIAHAYRQQVSRLLPSSHAAKWFSDKRPDNFLLIGALLRWFPDGQVLHTRRHLLDVGLSIYTQHLNQAVMPYSSSLEDIGHYIVQYSRLMAHWKRLWPNRIHDFDYDAFVRAPEQELRPVLEWLGLDWHPGCLAFHERRQTVKTASYWQVRQPLYQSASGRWKNYEDALAPLILTLQASAQMA